MSDLMRKNREIPQKEIIRITKIENVGKKTENRFEPKMWKNKTYLRGFIMSLIFYVEYCIFKRKMSFLPLEDKNRGFLYATRI